jgi:hypothetical protein
MIRRLRVRGWTYLLSVLWVVIGAGAAIYAVVTFGHSGVGEGYQWRWVLQWPSEPQVIFDVGVVAEVAWVLLSVPLLVAGFVRLRGWRPGNWLRAAGWAGLWVAGLALMKQAAQWAYAPVGERGSHGVLYVGETAICVAWLVLGGGMAWMLSGPQTRADSVSSSREPMTSKPSA